MRLIRSYLEAFRKVRRKIKNQRWEPYYIICTHMGLILELELINSGNLGQEYRAVLI
jgi:hypothetical protein